MAAALEQSQVAHYLVALGLVNPRAVIEGDLTVTDRSRRNSVFVVHAAGQPVHVVKQARPETAATLTHEAAVLRALARVPAVAGLVPTVVHHDPASSRLVLRSPADALPWIELRRVPQLAAGALGRALGAMHAARPEVGDAPERPPRLPEPDVERLRELSDGALDLLARIQGSRALCDRLREIEDERGDGAFVHGDLRWDNCLTVRAPGSRRRTRVLLIDWELAGRGDPAADLGVAFAEYLRLWLDSVPVVDPDEPGRYPPARTLESLRPAMQALWAGYRRVTPRPPPPRRIAELAGVRLLDAAMEQAQALSSANAEVRMTLQFAANVLDRPDATARQLLGLRE